MVALIFLLDLDWGRTWPLFLVMTGAGILLTRAASDTCGNGRPSKPAE